MPDFSTARQGLANELKMLDLAMEHDVPALLVDITNTIRHGDICLMGGSDPYLLEVKSSEKLDKRGRKQKRSLEKLHTFYEHDKVQEFRGAPELSRRTFQIPEITYIDEINECIAEAIRDSFAVRHPERGLHYLAITTGDSPPMAEMLGSLGITKPWMFLLNLFKSGREWAPYLPFILTIKDKNHLWSFIKGELVVVVIVEVDALKLKLTRFGGAPHTFAGGFSHGQNPPALLA